MDKAVEDDNLAKSKEWKRVEEGGELNSAIDNRLIIGDQKGDDGELEVHSLSGKERNHLFLNGDSGKEFADVSALSGMDSASDARCFALVDYDRDGWLDVAIVNANQPLMQLFHNDIGKLRGEKGGVIALRFVGGNTDAKASKLTNRDGYGAKVEVLLAGGRKIVREHRCGEGYAAQNSDTMVIGIGAEKVKSVGVRWPSGREYSVENVQEGTLLTAYEDREDSPFQSGDYRKTSVRPVKMEDARRFPLAKASDDPGIRVYTTMATWCAACMNHLPALEILRQDGVALFGVPVDPEDDKEKLSNYVKEKSPAYEMLIDLSIEDKANVSEFLGRYLQSESLPLPTTVITDGEGRILDVVTGVPNLSEVRKLAAKQ